MANTKNKRLLRYGLFAVVGFSAAASVVLISGVAVWKAGFSASSSGCAPVPEVAAAAAEYESFFVSADSAGERMSASSAALRLAETFDRVLKSEQFPSGDSWGFVAEKFPLARIQAGYLRSYDGDDTRLQEVHVELMWVSARVASGDWCR